MLVTDRRSLLKGAAAAASALLLTSARAPEIAPAMRMRRRSPDRPLYGAAVRADRLGDPALAATLARSCDWITPEFEWKWDAIEYARGGWWYERADRIAGFARDRGVPVRGHALLWDQSTPAWAKSEMAERRDWRLVERWFDGSLTRYAGDACEWDVVNEPIDTERGHRGLRRTCFQRAFGDDYVERALWSAHARAPGMRLMVNEYGLDYANPVERDRRAALLRLVERLKARGAPIGGVGMQAHLDLSKGPLDTTAIAAMLREIAGMGLSITITELDVKEVDRSASVQLRDRRVADEVHRYLDVVLAEPAVRGVVSWGLCDPDSWLQADARPATAAALNRGLPFDAALRPKPMWYAMHEALARRA